MGSQHCIGIVQKPPVELMNFVASLLSVVCPDTLQNLQSSFEMDCSIPPILASEPQSHGTGAPVARITSVTVASQKRSESKLRPNCPEQPGQKQSIASTPVVNNLFVHARQSAMDIGGDVDPPANAHPKGTTGTSLSHFGILKFSRHNQISFSRWSEQRAHITREIDLHAAATESVVCITAEDILEIDDSDEDVSKDHQLERLRCKKRALLQQKIDRAPITVHLESEQSQQQQNTSGPPRKRRFWGTREPDAANSALYIFSQTVEGNWEAFPVEHTFVFKPRIDEAAVALHRQVCIAEETAKRREKVLLELGQPASPFLRLQLNEDAEDSGASVMSAPDSSNLSDRASAIIIAPDEDTGDKLIKARRKRRSRRRVSGAVVSKAEHGNDEDSAIPSVSIVGGDDDQEIHQPSLLLATPSSAMGGDIGCGCPEVVETDGSEKTGLSVSASQPPSSPSELRETAAASENNIDGMSSVVR